MEKVQPGIYRHYKDKDYKVLFTAKDSETGLDMVVYQALYGDQQIWVRPKAMFLEEVETDGKKMPRFKFISEAEGNNREDFEDKYKRALADYQNLLKQTAKEKMEFAKFASEEFLYQILPVYDNLKESLKHGDEAADKNGWLEGIKHIIKQFSDVLSNLGVVEIETVGHKFDHHQMEAIDSEEIKDKKQDGLVAREVKPGYKLNGKVIIPARVIVYKIK